MTDVNDLNSPEARARRHEARMEKRRAAFLPVRDALHQLGIVCQTVNDIESLAPLTDDVVDVILRMLESVRSHDEVVCEMMVRSLPLAQRKFDGSVLEKILVSTIATPLEFAIANTLLLAKPFNVSSDAMKHARLAVHKK